MDTKMTFTDLDRMIDYWATELIDYQCIFQNQAPAINNVFWKVECNSIQIDKIGKRLGILHYMNIKLETDLLNANALAQVVEQLIVKLENQLMPFENQNWIDSAREIYYLFEKTNVNPNCYKNEVELIAREIKSIEKDNLKNTLEHIAKIMTALLKILEYIETKMESMRNRMRWIEQKIRSIFCARFYKN